MEWVYDDPLTKQEVFLLKKINFGKKVLKIMSLVKFLRTHKFRSVHHLRNSVFIDSAKRRHLFSMKEAEEIYNKKGGGEYPMTQKLIEGTGNYLKSYDPTPISWFVQSALGIVRMPMDITKSTIGEGTVDLATGIVHGLIETGVSGTNGIAADLGGPVGLAAVGIFTGIAAAAGSCLAIAEGDIGQAAVHAVNFLPGIGPAVVKAISKSEHLAVNINKHKDEIANIPLIGPTITGIVGGKRFSTRETIRHKWRTQRKRFVKH
jgi:hypothetical protein